MKEVKFKIDWYTKFILTVIALALCWLGVRPLFTAREVIANPGDNTYYGSVYHDVEEAIDSEEPIQVEVINWP